MDSQPILSPAHVSLHVSPESSQGSPLHIQYATALKPRAQKHHGIQYLFEALLSFQRPHPSASQYLKNNKHHKRIKKIKKNTAWFKSTQKLGTTKSWYHLAPVSQLILSDPGNPELQHGWNFSTQAQDSGQRFSQLCRD